MARRILKQPRRRTSNRRCHFDSSVESIADSGLEDGELQKMLTSPLFAQKASRKPDANGHAGEVSAQYTQAPIERKVLSLTHLKVRSLWRNPTHCFRLNWGT